ncbi:glycine-rich domain-containing protein [Actinoplanes sp. URMC 104]|uniref:glycine-rich domain-containing protein n=1 Tax=Actinoplanes sp. URMC 104 TaxID=3423409 RepID=UPI003F1AC7BD
MTVEATRIARTGRSLIPEALFDRLTARIAAEHPDLDAAMPTRIVDQALAFLGTVATATRPLGPSDLVDIGWHTFILYTEEYAEFCQRIAGRFIHHVPDDQEPSGGTPPTIPASTLADTVDAIAAAGFAVDEELWPCAAGNCNSKCSQCHAGCHDSPTKK